MNLQRFPDLRVMKPSTNARLIVVSNRLPLTLEKTDEGWRTVRSSGGLATAMNPLLGSYGGDWIGWAGDSKVEDNEKRQSILTGWAETDHCFAVNLPNAVAAGFYEGYAKGPPVPRTLCPIFRICAGSWNCWQKPELLDALLELSGFSILS